MQKLKWCLIVFNRCQKNVRIHLLRRFLLFHTVHLLKPESHFGEKETRMHRVKATFAIAMLFVATFAFCENLIQNGSMEEAAGTYWKSTGSGTLETVDDAFSGKAALRVNSGANGLADVVQDLTGSLKSGSRYKIGARGKLIGDPWDQVRIYLVVKSGDDTKEEIIARTDANNYEYRSLAGSFLVPDLAENSQVLIAIRSAFSTRSILIDDVTLISDLSVKLMKDDVTNAVTGVLAEIGTLMNRDESTVELTICNAKAEPIIGERVALEKEVPLSLDPGFYQLTVKAMLEDNTESIYEQNLYAGNLDYLVNQALVQSESIIQNPSLNDYHGWLKYLIYRIEDARTRNLEKQVMIDFGFRLAGWCYRIGQNPSVLDTLQGVFEWGYESKADESGQPFHLALPENYDPSVQYPLVVVMHGAGGNHIEYSGNLQSNPNYFELHVLGRARQCGYSDLCEIDVLDAMKYVQAHWSIDPQRIHAIGASMGGMGTFYMTSRHPDLFASARPQCGGGVQAPVLNSLLVPFYSVHSQDDMSVPVLLSRGPALLLSEQGGQVIIDETNGLGHASWEYTAGNTRAEVWKDKQRLPEMKEITQFRFTAMDDISRKAYWAEVVEWGLINQPADMKVTYRQTNQLYLNLDNIQILKLNLLDSPVDQSQPLQVVINTGLPQFVEEPLGDDLYVIQTKNGWQLQKQAPDLPKFRLRYPGGVHSLYHGEPLMIVYGTGGSETVNAKLKAVAEAACTSPNPRWPGNEGGGVDGIANSRMPYAKLICKADVDVTEKDQEKYNLVLIGSPEENIVIKKIVNQLPVKLIEQGIVCSDDIVWPVKDFGLNVTYLNPNHPQRLINWVMFENPDYYTVDTWFVSQSGIVSPDVFVSDMKMETLVAARNFDSRWNWVPGYSDSPIVPDELQKSQASSQKIAEAMVRIAGCESAIVFQNGNPDTPLMTSGITRMADMLAFEYFTPIAKMKVTGKQFNMIQVLIQGIASQAAVGFVKPDRELKDTEFCEVAVPPYLIFPLRNIGFNELPASYILTEHTLYEALSQIEF